MKVDPSLSPTDANAIQAVTPSDIYSWLGPDAPLTQGSERTGIENKWFALTGRVVAVKVEADGDLHIALTDATGDKPGIVVVEVPAKPAWCEIRKTVFSWTRTLFPFHTSSAKKLTLDQSPGSSLPARRSSMSVILLKIKDRTGEATFPTTLAWEIHPVMKLKLD